MSDLGPVDAAEFEPAVGPSRGADRRDVARQSRHPDDYGAIRVGDARLVASAGPVVAIPDLGLERAGRLTVERLLAGVAPSGLAPAHLAADLGLPPGMCDDDLAAFWAGIDAAAAEHGVAIATGHTARYDGCAYPVVGAGTALAVGRCDDLVGVDGARVGDRVVVSNGPAVAATGVLGHLAAADLDADTAAMAEERLAEATVVEAARHVAGDHVSAMAAAGDGGVDRCLRELARACGVGIAVARGRFPLRPGVAAVCDALDVDRWAASATGALVVTVAPGRVADVLSRFEAAGDPAAAVGEVVRGSGLAVDGTPMVPRPDSLWPAIARYGVV